MPRYTAKQIAAETYQRKGALYWASSRNPVPEEVLAEAGVDFSPLAQAQAQQEQLAEIRERMRNWQPDAEELAEMRAAFGPGETVVNVITGESITL